MLASGETDLAVVLTEGIVKAICDGNASRIVQGYVGSPLLWGIHVASGSDFKAISGLFGKKAAISRFGSGSHLMAYVNAKTQGWDVNSLNFEVVQNLEGAVAALAHGTADYFMWERFTTKPLVDSGVFRHLGDCPTPWPCFVVAASETVLRERAGTVRHVLEVINTFSSEFRDIPSIDRTLANRYDQKLDDIGTWLSRTRWSQKPLSPKEVGLVQHTLSDLGLIAETRGYDGIVASV